MAEWKDKNLKHPYQAFVSSALFEELVDKIFIWGLDRNITAEGGATALSQIKKLKEEVQEIEDALLAGDEDAIKDGIGDTQVVLLQICRLAGFDLVTCLEGAYEEIKDRKGRMENGIFIKETNTN